MKYNAEADVQGIEGNGTVASKGERECACISFFVQGASTSDGQPSCARPVKRNAAEYKRGNARYDRSRYTRVRHGPNENSNQKLGLIK